jgi:cell division protein FtsN
VIIVALLIVAIGFVVVRFYERAEGAVSQVDRLYACVTPHGGPARVWAYTPPCRGGQVVTWEVSGG